MNFHATSCCFSERILNSCKIDLSWSHEAGCTVVGIHYIKPNLQSPSVMDSFVLTMNADEEHPPEIFFLLNMTSAAALRHDPVSCKVLLLLELQSTTYSLDHSFTYTWTSRRLHQGLLNESRRVPHLRNNYNLSSQLLQGYMSTVYLGSLWLTEQYNIEVQNGTTV